MSFSASVDKLVEASSSPLVFVAPSWARIPLGCVAEILNGYPWKSDYFNEHDGVPVIRIRDVTSATTNTLYRGKVEEGYWIEDGDLLVGMDGDFNSRIWTGGRALLNQRVCRIGPNEQFYLKHFLAYVLPGYLQLINSETHSITVKHLSSKTLAEIPLPLPPLAEQRQIVAKIDSLSAKSKRARDQLDHIPRLVENYKQAILAAAFRGDLTSEWRKDHRQSISNKQLEAMRMSAWEGLREAGQVRERYGSAENSEWKPTLDLPLGWTWASLDQVACLVQYGSSAKATEDQRDGVAVLRMGNIQAGQLNLSSLKFLPKDHGEFPELLLEEGDVLFNRTNSAELVGKSAVYRGKPENASFASYLIRVRCSGLLPELLSGYINSAYGREWVASVVSQQVGQANVNGTKLRQLGIPVMPVEEQSEIARRIAIAFAWVDRLASEITSARKLIEHFDQAVLAKAFRGELVPQDPNDEPASALLERIRSERSQISSNQQRKKSKR